MKAGFSYCVKDSESYKRPSKSEACAQCLEKLVRTSLTCIVIDDDDEGLVSYCTWNVDKSKVPEGTISTCSCFAEIRGDEWPNDGMYPSLACNNMLFVYELTHFFCSGNL